jgi:hypothetical protein
MNIEIPGHVLDSWNKKMTVAAFNDFVRFGNVSHLRDIRFTPHQKPTATNMERSGIRRMTGLQHLPIGAVLSYEKKTT